MTTQLSPAVLWRQAWVANKAAVRCRQRSEAGSCCSAPAAAAAATTQYRPMSGRAALIKQMKHRLLRGRLAAVTVSQSYSVALLCVSSLRP